MNRDEAKQHAVWLLRCTGMVDCEDAHDMANAYLAQHAEIEALRHHAQYALEAVRAALSQRQNPNTARAEIALLIGLGQTDRMQMANYGFQLERDVREHLTAYRARKEVDRGGS